MAAKRSEFFDGACCVKGCDLPEHSIGFCNKHWRRLKAYGSPVLLEMPSGSYKGMPVEQRFMRNVAKAESGCWHWTAGLDSDGYGLFRAVLEGNVYLRAHRFSVAHFKRVHPTVGQNVCHTCDNPKCVNPEHLVIGSVLENQQDKWAKGRGRVHKGESHWSTSLTADDVRAIRASKEKQSITAQKYGVTQTTVSDIKRRKSWAHIE